MGMANQLFLGIGDTVLGKEARGDQNGSWEDSILFRLVGEEQEPAEGLESTGREAGSSSEGDGGQSLRSVEKSPELNMLREWGEVRCVPQLLRQRCP